MTIQEDYQMFSEIWKYYRVYREVKISDEFYEALVAEFDRIRTKYPTELCEDLLLAVVKEIDNRGRKLLIRREV